jgi:excinuclease UvrABC ATPase subunit
MTICLRCNGTGLERLNEDQVEVPCLRCHGKRDEQEGL